MRNSLLFLLHLVGAANVTINVTVTTSVISEPVPVGFTSFSCADNILDIISQTTSSGFQPRPSFVALMTLLGGGANIRLGHWWAENNSTHNNYPDFPQANATSLGRVAAALAAFGGTATPMVPPLDLSDGALVAATGAAFARWLPRAMFSGLELANEPDISAAFRGAEARYEATLRMWLSALAAAGVARAVVEAPVLAGTAWWPAMPGFLAQFAPRLGAFSQHRYGLTACASRAGPPTVGALLRVEPSWTSANDSALLGAVARARARFLVGEGNSVSCNGSAGVSDVFASALYALHAALGALAANASAFRWHGVGDDADHFFYQPVFYDTRRLREPGWDAAQPRPMFLGLWALADAAPAGSALLAATVDATGSALLRAWALRRAPGAAAAAAVLILHKDTAAGAAAARVAPPAPCAPGARATLTRLLAGAGGAAARSGSTWANQSFDGTTDGRPVGARASEGVPCVDGAFAFQVPALSAALLEWD
jgi:hypothetical protein